MSIKGTRPKGQNLLLAIVCCFCVAVASLATGVEPDQLIALKDGKYKTAATLNRHLGTASDVTWQENPARQAFCRFAEVHGIAIWLDRRVDPGQPLTVSIRATSLRTLLDSLTLKLNLGWCQIGDVIYVGPPSTAARLPSALTNLRKELARNSGSLPASNIHYAAVSTPRELANTVAKDYSLFISNAEKIPHDLFPEYYLPPLGPAEQLTLLLAGFDLTAEANGGSLKIVDLPAGETVEKSYPLGDKDPAVIGELASRFPKSEIRVTGNRVQVSGPAEDHAALAKLFKPASTTVVVPGEKRYTLSVVNQPAGGVLQALAKALSVTVAFDETAQANLNNDISFDVKDATRSELLHAVCDPANLKWVEQDGKLTISAK